MMIMVMMMLSFNLEALKRIHHVVDPLKAKQVSLHRFPMTFSDIKEPFVVNITNK